MRGLATEPTERKRLDILLVERGLAPTRSQARDMIRRGLVSIADAPVTKAGTAVACDAPLSVAEGAGAYVSRGAEKLATALDHFGFDPEGRQVLDIGASTGGFTDLLLARGAARVWAVDVGHGQLHDRLAADPRVVALEGVDARDLTPELVPGPVEAIVADVSFISLTLVLPKVLALTAPGTWLVALIKPQFEAGRDALGKGGIVRDPAAWARATDKVGGWLAAQPEWIVDGVIPSPIEGAGGNREFLIGARHGR
ncbi:MAG: TlyA family RNA methyltransferase [Hyphomicrobiales bacterium]|nr:TlyA family RNA methyltransferase [Hyphomicrobiales bacterium]